MTTIPSTNTVVNESSVPTSSIENTSETTEAIIENAEVIAETNEVIAETNEVIAETNEVIVETTSEIINVFFVDLVNNIDEYEGKLIETTVPIKNVFSDGTIHADIASMRYTDKDDVSKFSFDTINAEESDYYYQKGHELGEKLNSFLEEID